MEVLTRGEQALHEKRGFDEVAAVVEHAEDGHGLAGVAIHVVRPGAVIALGVFEEVDDLCQALDAFGARNEFAIDADHERHDAEAAGAGGDDTFIAGNVFAGHAGVGIGAFPVVVEAGVLHHGEQFVVAEFAGGRGWLRSIAGIRGSSNRRRRFCSGRGRRTLAEEVFVAMNAGDLDADGGEFAAVFGAVDYVAGEVGGIGGVPFEFDVAIVAGGVEIGAAQAEMSAESGRRRRESHRR